MLGTFAKQTLSLYSGEKKLLKTDAVRHILLILTGINSILVFCFISHIYQPYTASKYYQSSKLLHMNHKYQSALLKHIVSQLCQILMSNPACFYWSAKA